MKKTKLRLLLILLFLGGLIILPQKAKAAEIIPVNISVKYGQTEARTIFDMINEMRTNPYDTWCWDAYDNKKIPCPNLEELKYDYDLERVAMKRAAEIALSYEHERPMGGKVWDVYNEENIKWLAAGENISVGHTTAAEANLGWREDDKTYAGQGHRRNMLSSDYNCVGIGHVYYNGVHYWVEVFANRPEINTTEIPANDSIKTVSVSVDKKKIKKVDVTFDQDAYSLRIGENITPIITETRIDVVNFSSQGRGSAPVLDTPVVSIADSSVASYSNNKLSGLKEGTTKLTATLYGVTSSTSPSVSVHDCKNHWDTGSVTKKPTCTEAGEKTFTCSICRKTTKKESVPATGHNYASAWTTDIAATCEKTGTESRHCQNENCTATTDQRSIAALGHNWKDNGDETAICTRNGCKATHTHAWDSGTITTEPTCTAQGERTYHCTYEENGICTATKTKPVKALDHKYVLTEAETEAPTCEKDGVLHYKCESCSETKTEKDTAHLALGHLWADKGNGTATCTRNGCKATHTHKWDSGKITTKPTCTVQGEKEYCCIYANCPYKKTESLKATGHKNKETRNYKKPTCQEEGYTGDIYCKDCGILLSSGKVTTKYDHDWDGGKVTKEATCKEEGIVTYTCENCRETETFSIKKTEHNYIKKQHKNATCTENGYEVFVCKNCDATKTNSIPKTTHNYEIMEQKDATCTENGYSISVCQTCNDKKKEEIVAKGHSKGIKNKKTATCKAEGYTGDTYCRTCNIPLEEGKILPKLEHQWNDGTVTKRATYQTAGELTYRCRKCAAKRIISLEKLAYPKAGTSYTISGNEYKISKPGAEVILVKTSKTTKNVTVPAQIYAQGLTYKVTSIGAKAFNNNKKLTKVTIGTNIVKINSNAFFNCKNLKTVTIKSVRITGKTANKKAFKNAHKKLVIRVPKKVKKIYKKIFKGLKVK